MKNLKLLIVLTLLSNIITSQNYFLEKYEPYNNSILSPEEFLGYEIGFQHTRHDQIVNYLTYLSTVSNKADLINYGKTHEGRYLIILTVTSESNLNRLDDIQKEHLKNTVPGASVSLNNEISFLNLIDFASAIVKTNSTFLFILVCGLFLQIFALASPSYLKLVIDEAIQNSAQELLFSFTLIFIFVFLPAIIKIL